MNKYCGKLSGLFVLTALFVLTFSFSALGLNDQIIEAPFAFWLFGGASWWVIGALFVIGLALLVVELLVTPGFGAAGVSGFVLIAAGIFLASPNLQRALLALVIFLLLFIVAAVFALKWSKSRRALGKLVLSQSEKGSEGFNSSDQSLNALLGAYGTALTVLRPAGTGDFDGRRVDVVTDGEFVASGAPLQVVKIEGVRVIVKELK